jgi:hypothetical protein
MSFQNFDSFQNQHTPGDGSAGAGAPNAADATMSGQGDPSAASFQGQNAPEGSGAQVPQQGGDGKTTLWYVAEPCQPRETRAC